MTEISVRFIIVIPGSLDPGMHFSLEVKWLMLRTYNLLLNIDTVPYHVYHMHLRIPSFFTDR